MKTFLKQQGFTLIELMIVLVILGILASIAIPTYKDYMTTSKWGKAIAITRALKLGIENCLSDNGGDITQCNDLTEVKIGKYGVTEYAAETDDFLSIDLLSNASVKIIGKQPLADCILTITPSFSAQVGMITWRYTMASGSSYASVSKCQSFVKGSAAG